MLKYDHSSQNVEIIKGKFWTVNNFNNNNSLMSLYDTIILVTYLKHTFNKDKVKQNLVVNNL